jgi:hypothetical protein
MVLKPAPKNCLELPDSWGLLPWLFGKENKKKSPKRPFSFSEN